MSRLLQDTIPQSQGYRCHYLVLVLNSLGNCKMQPRPRVTLGTCWPHTAAFVCPGTSQCSTSEPLKPSQQFSWSPTSFRSWNVSSTQVSLLSALGLVHGRKGASGPNLTSTPNLSSTHVTPQGPQPAVADSQIIRKSTTEPTPSMVFLGLGTHWSQ